MRRKPTEANADDEIRAVLRDGLIFPVFQPVVALSDERPVGFEALARGPQGSRLFEPTSLFAAAAESGQLVELGWLCAVTALRHALAARLDGVAIFVNLDPNLLATSCPSHLADDYENSLKELDVVLELTERAVRRSNPADQFAAVTRARASSARIAMDDVGADPLSLTVMPLIRPDIIKLDRDVIQRYAPNSTASRVVRAVGHEVEHTGAQVLAEGVETEEHLRTAESVGATLAQGWRFGRPGPLPGRVQPSRVALARVAAVAPSAATPFAIGQKIEAASEATPRMLKSMMAYIEREAFRSEPPALLFMNVAHAENLDDDAGSRFDRMAGRGIEVVVLGQGLRNSWTTSVRHGQLSGNDPLADEQAAVLITSELAAAVLARRRSDTDIECFDAIVTHDRSLVIDAAQSMMDRLRG